VVDRYLPPDMTCIYPPPHMTCMYRCNKTVVLLGVTGVVDSGLRRISCYEPGTGMAGLKTVPISAASAAQRAGRAGRVAPGICVRLYKFSKVKAPKVALYDTYNRALAVETRGH
jgi:hypothetical protein